MHDHRPPRHDRQPEPWMPHPGTPDAPHHPPISPTSDDQFIRPVPAPQLGGGSLPGRLSTPRGEPSAFARFVVGSALGRKSIPVALGLALLGPLGLFYVSFLNGIAALMVV